MSTPKKGSHHTSNLPSATHQILLPLHSPIQPSEGKKTRGLSVELQKKLVEAVERSGGLDSVNLKVVCDSDKTSFGTPNSPLRRKVQNQIDRWKGKSAPAFEKLKHNIKSFSNCSSASNGQSTHVGKPPKPPAASDRPSSASEPSIGSSFASFSRYAKVPQGSFQGIEFTVMNNLRIDRECGCTILSDSFLLSRLTHASLLCQTP